MRRTRLAAAALAAALGAAAAAEGALARSALACDPAHELAARRKAVAELRDATPGELAAEHYKLGLWARDAGLAEEAHAEFRSALALDAGHEGAHHALGHERKGEAWLTAEEAMAEKGLVLRGGTWLLREEAEILDQPAKERERRREEQAKVTKLLDLYARGGERAQKLARESLQTVDAAYRLEPLAYALRSPSERLRLLAAEELGALRNRRAIRPLLHRAVFDPSEAMRHAAIDAARAIGDANLVMPLVRALGSEDATVRMHAADAIARVGDVRGVQYLVYQIEKRGGGAPRAYSMFAAQLSFIQDFDVEVAQTAFIADPIVSTMQEGTVLDVQVVATEQTSYLVEREVIHGALSRLTGATDVKNVPGAWAAWYREHGAELTAAAQ